MPTALDNGSLAPCFTLLETRVCGKCFLIVYLQGSDVLCPRRDGQERLGCSSV